MRVRDGTSWDDRRPLCKLVPSKTAQCSIAIRASSGRENEDDRDLGSREGRRDKEIFRWSHDTSLAVSSPLFRCRATEGRGGGRALSFLVSLSLCSPPLSSFLPPGFSLDVVDQSNLREKRRPTHGGAGGRPAGRPYPPPAAGQAGKQEVSKAPLNEGERHLLLEGSKSFYNHYYNSCSVEYISETCGETSKNMRMGGAAYIQQSPLPFPVDT